MGATIPAVVAPAFNATGLGIVRDLGRAGVPVIAVDHYPKSIGLTSRYAVPAVSRDPRYDEEGLLQDLERIGAALPQRAVLFPAFDDHVWAFSRHAERLEKYFILPFARWATMQRLADKETQMQAAWAAGVDTPRTFFVHGPDDLEEAAREVPFPALFKPLRHQEMRRRFGVKVVLAETAADLPAAYEKASICGGLMLQEIVPGRRPGLLHLRRLPRRLRRGRSGSSSRARSASIRATSASRGSRRATGCRTSPPRASACSTSCRTTACPGPSSSATPGTAGSS